MDRVEHVNVESARTAKEVTAGGSVTEGIGGAGAIVLSILGLIGIYAPTMASISAIAIGGGLLIAGGTIAARFSKVVANTRYNYAEEIIGGGMAMEALCGVAGIALGILALLGIVPLTLLSAASIVFGAALIMASGAMARLNALPIKRAGYEEHEAARDVLYAASGSEVLVGAGAVTLGILALAGYYPLTLNLVAFLSVGASILMSGTSIASRMFGALH